MNSIQLTGRLTRDPELRATQSGKSVCGFSIAVNRVGSEETDFINCQVWGTQAENLCKYQHKGNLIGVIGSIRVDKFQDDQGNDKYKSYVLVNNIEYLSSKSETATQETTQNATQVQTSGNGLSSIKSNEIVLSDDDLPF